MIALAIIPILILAYFSGILRGAPFLPTKQVRVEGMIAAAGIKPGDKLVDLGSGDGRIVIAAAKAGAYAYGFELNPLLVLWSRIKIRKAGLQSRASIKWKNFWFANLQEFDVVTVFGITGIMNKLEQKFSKELKPGSRVVCNIFPLPNWTATKDGGVYKYVVK